MNYMKQVAQMLGVELDEEFKLKNYNGFRYKINENGYFAKSDLKNEWVECYSIYRILSGEYEIIKLPKQILDDIEKEYLTNVIKPFRDKVIFIIKYCYDEEFEYLTITYQRLDGIKDVIHLPLFKKGTMYKGMELDKKYSLYELGL